MVLTVIRTRVCYELRVKIHILQAVQLNTVCLLARHTEVAAYAGAGLLGRDALYGCICHE